MEQLVNIITKALAINSDGAEAVRNKLEMLGIKSTTEVIELPESQRGALAANFRTCEEFIDLAVFRLLDDQFIICLRISPTASGEAWDFRLLSKEEVIQAEEWILVQL